MGGRRDHGFSDDVATVPRAIEPTTSGVSARFLVEVVDGADQGKQTVLDLSRPSRVLLGKSSSCDIQLVDREVSRRHAALDVRGAHLGIQDLGSTNGTLVNGLRVTEALLVGGEIVRVGTTTIRVTLLDAAARSPLSSATRFGKVLGESAEMRRLYPLCEKLAASDVPLVIEGETGTGKEVLAESIHDRSRRAGGPFVVFDCTAVPAALLESALFGHDRGAFTGATETRIGVFEEAQAGTLLIDEIGDLDISLQATLLRALERKEVRRVGGKKWISVDARVIATTRRNLDQAVQDGTFRDDLFFRLAVTRIELPPLRKRRGDVAVLARQFWGRLKADGSEIPAALLSRLEAYEWPGNIRELHHTVSRHVALGELAPASIGGRAALATKQDLVEEVLSRDLPLSLARTQVVEEFERRYVERVVAKHGGNVSRAAEASGLARRYFQLLRARRKGSGGEGD